MGLIGGALGYRLLKLISTDGQTGLNDGSAYNGRSKIEALFGPRIWEDIEGKTVIDFGCGAGDEAVEMAGRGAAKVLGLDIREDLLGKARLKAERAGVSDRCAFVREVDHKADVVLSVDAFEHFDDPAGALKAMRSVLKDDGVVLAVFGPTWYHPLGGHMFSVFPWSHLVFTERTLIRWRADFKSDGATRFSEIDGGLNGLTIRRFERLVAESDFEFKSFEAVPIRRAKWLHNSLTREFLTAVVRCRLAPRAGSI